MAGRPVLPSCHMADGGRDVHGVGAYTFISAQGPLYQAGLLEARRADAARHHTGHASVCSCRRQARGCVQTLCERVRITCTCADRKAAVAMEVGRERSLAYNELGCRGMVGNVGQLRAYNISRISGIALRPSSAEPFMRIFWYGTVSGNLLRSGRCCHRTPELSRVTGPSKGHSVRRCRLRYSSRRRISTTRATS